MRGMHLDSRNDILIFGRNEVDDVGNSDGVGLGLGLLEGTHTSGILLDLDVEVVIVNNDILAVVDGADDIREFAQGTEGAATTCALVDLTMLMTVEERGRMRMPTAGRRARHRRH